ncbi:uncharacterized protein BP01DRAFT_381910 [Aspergillus saccharolyticus JOP 1030-1]|uniref:Uncharacterized protein n=1 Tax=Aspergillus saccharolyticus JOP 1030-1 TaxID=1450539 RepID=A0A318ZHM8_9EURO|nr:hypothetical protein BP01DRAFT_381910 [Aspergillus saccharolyticus JOP 1030-1]PYH46277.1 hypothetical protein BP01DRAFT_381910 [Aspergillus saccharolyticus JOP 1030-1]
MVIKQVQGHFRGLISKSSSRTPWKILQEFWKSFQKSNDPPSQPDVKHRCPPVSSDAPAINYNCISAVVGCDYMHAPLERLIVVNPDPVSESESIRSLRPFLSPAMRSTSHTPSHASTRPESESAGSIRSLRPFISSAMRSTSFTHSLTSVRSNRPESRLSNVDARPVLSEPQEGTGSFEWSQESIDLYNFCMQSGVRAQRSRNLPPGLFYLPDSCG